MVQKSIFDYIKEDNLEKVKELVENDETIVNSIAPQKPYDTRGMSPFQVSLCTYWHREISMFLLKHNPDMNFIANDGKKHPEIRPVLFDCVRNALWHTRRLDYNVKTEKFNWTSSNELQEESFDILLEVVNRGANVNAVDKCNRNSLFDAVGEINAIYQTNHETNMFYPQRQKLERKTLEQYRRILKLLIDNGADKNSTSNFSKTNIKETYQNELIWKYIGDMWE